MASPASCRGDNRVASRPDRADEAIAAQSTRPRALVQRNGRDPLCTRHADHGVRPCGSGGVMRSAPPPLSWFDIFRLGLVQTALGAVIVLTTSTLNRVM